MPYRFMIVDEDGLDSELRDGLARLLSATLNDGERYRGRAWRTLRPVFRVVALDDHQPIGQGSCFWIPCQPPTRVLGLGDVAVAPDHRRRHVARVACTLATEEGWRLQASAILARTKLLRSVLADLGYVPAIDGRFLYFEDGTPTCDPDLMAAVAHKIGRSCCSRG